MGFVILTMILVVTPEHSLSDLQDSESIVARVNTIITKFAAKIKIKERYF
jgi:hypothetical protein